MGVNRPKASARCTMLSDPPPLLAVRRGPSIEAKRDGPPRPAVFPVYFDWKGSLEQARQRAVNVRRIRQELKSEREAAVAKTRGLIDRSLGVLHRSCRYLKSPIAES